jgi:hypothetical protein
LRFFTTSIAGSIAVRSPLGVCGERRRAAPSALSGSSGRDAERVGQRVGAQQLVGLGVAAALAVVGLLLGDELDLADVAGVLLEPLAHPRDVRLGGVALEVDVDEDLAPDVVRRARGRPG